MGGLYNKSNFDWQKGTSWRLWKSDQMNSAAAQHSNASVLTNTPTDKSHPKKKRSLSLNLLPDRRSCLFPILARRWTCSPPAQVLLLYKCVRVCSCVSAAHLLIIDDLVLHYDSVGSLRTLPGQSHAVLAAPLLQHHAHCGGGDQNNSVRGVRRGRRRENKGHRGEGRRK